MDYEGLRAQYRPQAVAVLFIGESAPDPGNSEARFFYNSALSGHDNLFRGLMRALYGAGKEQLGQNKVPWLRRFQKDGYWLIDAVPHPGESP